MGTHWAIDWRLLVAVLFGLVMFGFVFNTLVDWLAARKEGYTSLLVVLGVMVTLAGVALISWQAAVYCFLGFVASGSPMVVGDIARAVKARDRALERIKKEVQATNSTNETNNSLFLKPKDLDCLNEREFDDAS